MENKIEKLVREGIRQISPYKPGKPIEELQREYGLKKIIKLASNENPFGPSPEAIKAIKNTAETVGRYPDGAGYYLKNKISRLISVPVEEIILGSGSSEIISMTLETFVKEGEEVIYPHPSFLIYKILALKIGAKRVEVPLNEDFSYDLNKFLDSITDKTKVIILCNPNNPTGTIIRKKQLSDFLKNVPENIIIISDEAYFEYVESDDFGSAFPYYKEKNIVIARTFSKIYGLAGLRLGYGIGRKEILGYLERIRPPFNTTSVAQNAAIAAIEDQKHVKNSREKNIEGKCFLYREFENSGIEYVPSETNFILFKVKKNGIKIVKELEKRGIIVRAMTAFGLGENYIRVTIGTEEENKIFVENLKEVLKEL